VYQIARYVIIVIFAYWIREFIASHTCLIASGNYLSWENTLFVASFIGIAFTIHAIVDVLEKAIASRT
jgi:hypothetical protein